MFSHDDHDLNQKSVIKINVLTTTSQGEKITLDDPKDIN